MKLYAIVAPKLSIAMFIYAHNTTSNANTVLKTYPMMGQRLTKASVTTYLSVLN